MRASIRKRIMTACCLLIGSSSVWASGADPLVTIQKKWAECQYQSKDEDQQVYCLENLVKLSDSSLQHAPDRNDLKIWLAISKSSLAGADGGLGGLSLAKQARALLEEVVKTAPETLDGSAYVTLGTLYYKVPGWPVGFGDDDKAEEMLKKALKYNPNGIDPNYFYADFLAEDGRKAEAIKYLQRAAVAPARETRPLADQGRMAEVQRRLKELGAQ